MAGKNVIVECRLQRFGEKDTIPADAKYVSSGKEFVRMVGWASNPYPYYENYFIYQVPIYKKRNMKDAQRTEQ